MPNDVGENQTKRKLKSGELVLFMGVNQMRTPNVAMIAAACGFDGSTSTSNTIRLRWRRRLRSASPRSASALRPSPVSAPATRTTPLASSIAAPSA